MSDGRDVSFAERGLWFMHHAGAAGICNVGSAVRIRSWLDHERLFAAFRAVTARHEVLRTGYDTVGGRLMAFPRPAVTPETSAERAGSLSAEDLAGAIDAEHERPFDLEAGGLWRMKVWSAGEDDHVMMLTAHHIAVDRGSLLVCAEELFARYAGDADLPAVTAPYADFVAEQSAMVNGPEGGEAWRYWSARLPSERSAPPFPARTERAGHRSRVRMIPLAAGRETAERVERLAWDHRVPPNVVLLALWITALRERGEGPIVVGVPRTLRHARFGRTVGCFINTLPVLADLSERTPLPELIDGLRVQLRESVRFQNYPLELLAQRLPGLGAAPGRPPVYDVTFNFITHDPDNLVALAVDAVKGMEVTVGGLRMAPFIVPPGTGPTGEFSLHITEHPGHIAGMVGYDSVLFDEAVAADLSSRFIDAAAGRRCRAPEGNPHVRRP